MEDDAEVLDPDRSIEDYKEAALHAIDFERYARIINSVLRTDLGAVTLLDGCNQFKLAANTVSGTLIVPDVVPQEETVCQYTVQQREAPFVVSDLTTDDRFKHLDCVVRGPKFRTYAGHPIRTSEGFNIGAVCAIDDHEREWSAIELAVLQDLSRMITNDFRLYFQNQAILVQQKMQRSIISFLRANTDLYDLKSEDLSKGRWQMEASICKNAATILRVTLATDAVYIARFSNRHHDRTSTDMKPEIVASDSILEGYPIDLPSVVKSLIRNLSSGVSSKDYHRDIIPSELQVSLGPAANAVMISSWPVMKGLSGGMIIIQSNIAGRIFQRAERNYLEAFASTLLVELQKEQVMDADQVKAQFISSLSHELRTPLHGLLHNTEVLLETSLDQEQEELLREIATCGNAQLDIVETMLDLRTTSDRKHRSATVRSTDCIDIVELVEESVQMAINRHARRTQVHNSLQSPQAFRNVNIVIDCPLPTDGVGLSKRLTHRKTLMQILGHLLSNSLKWTVSGYIKVKIDLETRSDENLVLISIFDTGIGIEPDFLKNKLFQSFSKEDSFTAGLGLGLSVVADLVSQIKGSIEVTSVKNENTFVRLVLPMIVAPDQSDTTETRQLAEKACILMPQRHSGSGGQLLTELLRRDLVQRGFEVFVQRAEPVIGQFSALFVMKDLSERDSVGMVGCPIVHMCGNSCTVSARDVMNLHFHLGAFYGPTRLDKLLAEIRRLASRQSPGPKLLQSVSRKRGHSPEVSMDNQGKILRDRIDLAAQGEARASSTSLVADCKEARTSERNFSIKSSNVKSPRVLIVEDNPTNSRLLTRFMEKRGLKFKAVFNGQEAIDAVVTASNAEHSRYNVILMDIQMPVLDGLQATAKIREIETEARVPRSHIVACTGLSAVTDKEAAAEVGCNDFLTKPISLSTLRRLFDDWTLGNIEPNSEFLPSYQPPIGF